MEIKQYAPVVIPTLNRFEHFKRCLESLEKCSGASLTEVYVGFDYPPSDAYLEGWLKLGEYLNHKEKSNGFKNLYVFRRERNYGICKKGSNAGVTIAEVMKKYDRYIFTEDDNEFSPNFLEYMNWGLESFKDDDRIISICGYTELKIDTIKNNVYAYPRFNGWGKGVWVKKQAKLHKFYDQKVIYEELRNTPLKKAFQGAAEHPAHLLGMLAKNQTWGDTIVGSLPENERYVILPTLSKVRNLGHDGSGQHGKGCTTQNHKYLNQDIDLSEHFMPIVEESVFECQVHKYYEQYYSKEPFKYRLKCSVVFLIWKLFRINVYKLG